MTFFMGSDSSQVGRPCPHGASTHRPRSDAGAPGGRPGAPMAEVDGNRTRRTGIARPTRFEGGGRHQVAGHLRPAI